MRPIMTKFIVVKRLFIRDNKVDGVVNTGKYISNKLTHNDEIPPDIFIRDILTANIYTHCVIDVGLLDCGTWVIVEINPPFALDNYGWNIDKYYTYCKLVWQDISK